MSKIRPNKAKVKVRGASPTPKVSLLKVYKAMRKGGVSRKRSLARSTPSFAKSKRRMKGS